jgi:hypothetical protein
MQRIFIFLYSLLVGIFTMNPLTAIDLKDKQVAKKDLRILKLLPSLFMSFGCGSWHTCRLYCVIA